MWRRKGKTGNRPARLVFASSYFRQWLDVYPRKEDKTAPIFCSTREPYDLISRSGLYDQLKWIAKIADVTKGANCHNWRHTRATDLATKMTEQEMKAVLGWTGGSSMASIYVHLSATDVNKAMLKANNIEVDKEGKEPSLLTAERCSKCKEWNDNSRNFCFKCGLPLSEKMRIEEATAEKKAQEEHDVELIERALRAFEANQQKIKALYGESEPFTREPREPYIDVPEGELRGIRDIPPEEESDIIKGVMKPEPKEKRNDLNEGLEIGQLQTLIDYFYTKLFFHT